MIKTKAKITNKWHRHCDFRRHGPEETKISPKSGYKNWTLQEVNVELLGIKDFSHIKQSVVWV